MQSINLIRFVYANLSLDSANPPPLGIYTILTKKLFSSFPSTLDNWMRKQFFDEINPIKLLCDFLNCSDLDWGECNLIFLLLSIYSYYRFSSNTAVRFSFNSWGVFDGDIWRSYSRKSAKNLLHSSGR